MELGTLEAARAARRSAREERRSRWQSVPATYRDKLGAAALWLVLALQNAFVTPRARNDILLVVALSVATLARTQFAVLVAVLPVALFIHSFAFARADGLRRRLRAAAEDVVSAHRELAVAYAILV